MAIIRYSNTTEKIMKTFFDGLSEKDRRLYAAVEVSKLGHGGLIYICQLLDCSAGTVHQGQRDLLQENIEKYRIRKPGGGRKSVFEKHPALDDIFLKVLKDHTAGDPMDENTRWTDLSNKEIRQRIGQQGIHINKNIVAK